ncbi:MAG: type II secretion system F family protein, partial [Candidatus Omnitrophica bacterium]|nr:type II secretion system F family protein [Candidatus Omnitrophota bacterium]
AFGFLDRFKKVKYSDLNMFTRQFYVLQKAGLPIISALSALQEETSNPVLQEVIAKIIEDIQSGTSLTMALERHPKVFDNLYVNMIKSGEASGTLDDTLQRLAILGENEEKVRMRIKSATRYPVIVVTTIIGAFAVLTTFIVPRFEKLYSQFKAELPLPTKMLLGANYILRHYWWLIAIIIVASVIAFKKLIATRAGHLWWDSVKLKVPIFGPMVLKITISRFARITGTLMASGIPILNILELTRDGVGNEVVGQVIDRIRRSVNDGKGMVEPMRQSALFPPVVIQMVKVGEETGNIQDLLIHIADYYDEQVEYTLNNMITLIEPILIFVLGIGVLFMALGIFLPVWNLTHVFKK